jgi:AcrR family transcriptional regulator
MTATPWGPTELLRERRLSPGPGKKRERVEQSQRERLLAGMAAVVAERGYEATRVADVLEVSGVSRNAFYKLYANKLECFLAVLDAIVELSGPTVFDVYRRTEGPWETRMGAMFDALGIAIVAQPAVARVGWLEYHAAGPEAVERIERIDAKAERIIRAAIAESPERAGIPPAMVRATIGGLRNVIHARLREDREDEIPELMPALLEWLLSYRTPGQRLQRPRKPGPGLVPPAAPPADARERILAAITEIVAEKGYPAMAITEIASRASVSLTTFYRCFPGKEEAFVAAIDRGRRRSVQVVWPLYDGAEDWQHAVAAGLHGFFALFTVETEMARLGGIATYEGGPKALEERSAVLRMAEGLLDGGYQLRPETPAIAAEGIGASIYSLMSSQIRRRGPESLYEMAPTAAFIALAPFVGSDAAAAIANERPPTSG